MFNNKLQLTLKKIIYVSYINYIKKYYNFINFIYFITYQYFIYIIFYTFYIYSHILFIYLHQQIRKKFRTCQITRKNS